MPFPESRGGGDLKKGGGAASRKREKARYAVWEDLFRSRGQGESGVFLVGLL